MTPPMIRRIRAVLFAGSVLVIGRVAVQPDGSGQRTAAARGGWSAGARTRLAESLTYRGRGGMWAAGAPWTAALRTGDAAEYRVRLVPGRRYAIHGVCGESCSGITLRLYAPDGREVGADVEHGPAPLLEIHPEHAEMYRVRLTMIRCSQPACHTATGIFSAVD